MMIDCAKARELSDGYIDGELEESDCLAYEEHISCCDACHEEYDILKKISADLSSTVAPLPEGFAARAHTALVEEQLTARKNKDTKKFVFPYYRTASVMAAALVIAVVGKYGIYDTYKKVNNDASRMASEIESGTIVQTSVLDNLPDAKVEDPAVSVNEPEVKSVLPESKPDVVSGITDARQTHLAQDIAENTLEYKTESSVSYDSKSSDTASYPTEVAAAAAESATEENEAVYNPESSDMITNETADTIHMARMIHHDTDSAIVTESEEKASSGGSSEPMKKEATHPEAASDVPSGIVGGGGTAASPTELVPATVIIHNNGDGSMMMFKKFLLTFLDSSEIVDNGSVITVTVTADEYDGVMQYIKSNEYVKSVTEGTPFDGKAVINIK